MFYKHGYIYTDGGDRTANGVHSSGIGIHGYFFNELPSLRYSKVPVMITPEGYQPKPTGAQIKDKNYNPIFKKWGHKVSLRDENDKIVQTKLEPKETPDILLLDAWFSMDGTNNRAELKAIMEILDPDNDKRPVNCEYLTIRSDSKVTLDAINGGMAKWKANGWRNSGGNEPKNLDLWMEMDVILSKLDLTKISFEKIKAHNGDYGNEAADRNATMGVMCGINSHHDAYWKVTDAADKNYWDADKILPHILRTTWSYQLTGAVRKTTTVDDAEYVNYFVGNHTKDAGDPILLGAEISDATFGVVLNKNAIPEIDNISDFHISQYYTHTCNMYKSELLSMVRLSDINTAKVIWFLRNACMPATVFKSQRTDLVTPSDNVISILLDPPKLSYRSIELERELRTALLSSLKQLGHKLDYEYDDVSLMNNIVLNDITDLLYIDDKKGKKLEGQLDKTTRRMEFLLEQPCSSKKVKQIISVDTDIPSRNTMSGIANDNPKVYIACIRTGNRSYRYGTLITTDSSLSYWCGYYQCTRILDDAELDK